MFNLTSDFVQQLPMTSPRLKVLSIRMCNQIMPGDLFDCIAGVGGEHKGLPGLQKLHLGGVMAETDSTKMAKAIKAIRPQIVMRL